MSNLKCPICNSNLITTRLCDGILPNPNKGKIDEIFCDKCKMHGTKEIWEALINERQHATDCQDLFIEAVAQKLEIETELERTHKALVIAVDALKYANKCIKGGCVNWETEIDKALEQITALTEGGDNE